MSRPDRLPPVSGHARRRRWRASVGLVLAGVALSAGAGCRQGASVAADTAKVTIDDERYLIRLDDCGRDGSTVFLIGQGDGAVLQAVVGLAEPSQDGEPQPDASGFSMVLGPDRAVGAFGVDAAGNIGIGRAVGGVESVRIDGSRVRFTVTFEHLDERNQPTGAAGGRGTLDANCGDHDPTA